MSPRAARPARKTGKKTGKTAKKTAAKSAQKTGRKTGSRKPGTFLPGEDPRRGHGLPGRSGRKSDAFREELAAIRDEEGLALLRQVLSGEVRYTLDAKCEHCGEISVRSDGEKNSTFASLHPSPDVRLRAAELTMKYTVGQEKTVRLEGFVGAQSAFELIKMVLRAKLGPDQSAEVIADIHRELSSF
jgi:hypothetical protein